MPVRPLRTDSTVSADERAILETKEDMSDSLFKRKNRNKINPGDVFAFKFDNTTYGFGRIVSRIIDGHIAEIYNYFAKEPKLDLMASYERFMPPVILNAYGLFQLKQDGDWGFIGTTPGYVPDAEIAKTRFAWGSPRDQKAIDICDKSVPISDSEAASLPRAQPWGDYLVKEYIKNSLNKKKAA
jgi:Immunity protein 26